VETTECSYDLYFGLIDCLFFFFSSRRRHTRWPRDWSSDVCSSDLATCGRTAKRDRTSARYSTPFPSLLRLKRRQHPRTSLRRARSEERRVGKECRSRWGAYH